ncbi:MAG: hypothetical protein JKY15_04105, partial [Deltaproteobacteria bacterium]|nr:hypothetical protein [Deltaproteobacteria bacterium]
LLKANNPDLTWKQLKNLVISSGTPIEAMKGKTLSGRRIRAIDEQGIGAFSCHNQEVFARMLPIKDQVKIKEGESVKFKILHINCADAGTKPEVLADHDQNLDLQDPDQTGDYTGEWKAEKAGTYKFDFGDAGVVTVEVKEKKKEGNKDDDKDGDEKPPWWPLNS